MINIPIGVLRVHFAQMLRLDLRNVNDQELKYFCWVDGPFSRDDWKNMPRLFKLLTGKDLP